MKGNGKRMTPRQGKARRRRLGLGLRPVAHELEIHHTTLIDWEAGVVKLKTYQLQAWKTALDKLARQQRKEAHEH